MNAELIAQQEKVNKYVEVNKVEANSFEGACGDGRPAAEGTVSGRVRKFGSDIGDLMAIKAALNIKGKEITAHDLVLKYSKAIKEIRGEDSVIDWHTDEHSLYEGGIGCGHAAKAVAGIQENLRPEEVKAIWDEVTSGNNERSVLKGGHAEEAVLLVHGDKFSVNSTDGTNMFFVVDVDRALGFLDKVVPLLGIEGLSPDEVRAQWNLQMQKTAGALAAGKNMFDIDFEENGDFKTSFAGAVPQK